MDSRLHVIGIGNAMVDAIIPSTKKDILSHGLNRDSMNLIDEDLKNKLHNNYQIKEMYLRYFAWQFIGKGNFDWQIKNKDGTITKHLEGIDWSRYILPLAFIFGIFGKSNQF